MAKCTYSASEKQSWKRGFFAGLCARKKKKKSSSKKPTFSKEAKALKKTGAKPDAFVIKTYFRDDIDNFGDVTVNYASTLESARKKAYEEEKRQRKLADHSLVTIYSTIDDNAKYIKKKKQTKDYPF